MNPGTTLDDSNSILKKAMLTCNGKDMTEYLRLGNTANLKSNIVEQNEWISNAVDDTVLRLSIVILNLRCLWNDVQNEGHMRNWKKDPTIIDPRTDKETNLAMEDVILKMNHQETLGTSFANSLLVYEYIMEKWLLMRDPETSKKAFTQALTDMRTDLPFCNTLYEKAKKHRLQSSDLPNRDKRKLKLKSFYKQTTESVDHSSLHDLVRKLLHLNPTLRIPSEHRNLVNHVTKNNAPKETT